jgi:leucyl-tRNA synthetase
MDPSAHAPAPSAKRSDAFYDAPAIEARWQQAWQQANAFAVPEPDDEREPAYVFAGCPFTSGDAHMGHIRSYTIADAYARFCRTQGLGVLFSLGFDSFGLPAELEAIKREITPQQWVARCIERMRGQFERLGYSCDWSRTFDSSQPHYYKWTQWLFLAMMERGLVYRREAQVNWCDSCQTVLAALQAKDGECWRCHGPVRLVRRPQWFMRISAYVEDNERGLEQLPGWTKPAVGAQRAVIGRVDGVEVDATTLDGRSLTVFTPHGDALADAAFVALSPGFEGIDEWVQGDDVRARLDQLRETGVQRADREQVAVVQTGAQVSVPGATGLLPVVVTPAVDGRFGPTAVLGVPDVDATDRAIAAQLPAPASMAWKTAGTAAAETRPAVRYKAADFPISRQRSWGAPIPLVHCERCGTVPVPKEQLPVELPDELKLTGEGNPLERDEAFLACACPTCGGAARRESDTIDCHVDGMWMCLPITVPFEDRPEQMFSHPDYQRWLPARQIVWGADAGGYMFDQRLIPKVLQDIGEMPPIEGREPFTRALMHEMVRMDGRKMSKHLGNVVDPNDLVERVGADTVRLAVLYAAAPAKSFNWNDQPLRYCHSFLTKVYAYAGERLRDWERPASGHVDTSDKLRRKLATWCRIAREKVSADYEALEMHRAARNVMLLFTRLRDFEERAAAARGGELDERDREAIVEALLLLVQMLAPLAPHLAEELWATAGMDSLVSTERWGGAAFAEEPARSADAT